MSDRPGRRQGSRTARLAGEIKDRIAGRSDAETDAGWDRDEATTDAERDAGVAGRPDRDPPGDGGSRHAAPAQPREGGPPPPAGPPPGPQADPPPGPPPGPPHDPQAAGRGGAAAGGPAGRGMPPGAAAGVAAGAAGPGTGHDAAGTPEAPPAGAAPGAGVDTGTGSSLITPDRARDFQERWTALKGEFVDEPRRAVHGANELVGEVLDELETLFRHQRDDLEQQFSRQDASTEDLRQALGRYREFFDRLLSL